MRAAVNTQYGPPEVVHVRQVPDPEPAIGEVLVRVHTTTVNRTDCAYRAAHPWFMRALTGLRVPRRTVLGTEYAGEVVAVGEGASTLAVGDQVFGYNEGRFGTHAELLAVPEDSMIARIPSGVDVQRAAASTEGGHYARSSILRAGDRVLVIGATGGIGSAAVQLLTHLEAKVNAVCAVEHEEMVRGLGAETVIDRFTEDVAARSELYDVVVDAVGKSTFAACRRILLPGGRYVSSELGPGGQNLPLAALGAVGARMPGGFSQARRVVFPYPEEGRHVAQEIAGLLGSGAFSPVIDHEYGLDEIVEAYRYVEKGEKVGSVLIRM